MSSRRRTLTTTSRHFDSFSSRNFIHRGWPTALYSYSLSAFISYRIYRDLKDLKWHYRDLKWPYRELKWAYRYLKWPYMYLKDIKWSYRDIKWPYRDLKDIFISFLMLKTCFVSILICSLVSQSVFYLFKGSHIAGEQAVPPPSAPSASRGRFASEPRKSIPVNTVS